jgi:hypothetical protein
MMDRPERAKQSALNRDTAHFPESRNQTGHHGTMAIRDEFQL